MKEALLQFVWNHRLYNPKSLETSNGEPVTVDHPGFFNTLSGPDFSNARIRIDNTLWVGQVEIHIKSSDWIRHSHHHDKAYDNVVLHVVWEHDCEIQNKDGVPIPTLEIRGKVQKNILDNYRWLEAEKKSIPCGSRLSEVPSIKITQWQDRLLIQRLERKVKDIEGIYLAQEKDLLQTFYVLFAGYLGQNSNRTCFQMLASYLPLRILLKHADQPLQLDALLFGVANLIDQNDQYGKILAKEYEFLQKKYDLKTITCLWRFGGVRPPAFPTKRIAILAAVVPFFHELKSAVLSSDQNHWKTLLQELKLSVYWSTRYRFGESSNRQSNTIPKTLMNILGINVIAPYVYFVGKELQEVQLQERSVTTLESISCEKNSIIDKWKALGLDVVNAADSQSLIELTTTYCNAKKCLFCGIGKTLLST